MADVLDDSLLLLWLESLNTLSWSESMTVLYFPIISLGRTSMHHLWSEPPQTLMPLFPAMDTRTTSRLLGSDIEVYLLLLLIWTSYE
jgi:hypothetical protein